MEAYDFLWEPRPPGSITRSPTKKELLWEGVPAEKIDMLVDEKVMGLDGEHGWHGLLDAQKGWVYVRNIPCYSTDASLAWEVVDVILGEGYVFVLYSSQYSDVASLERAGGLKGEVVFASACGDCVSSGDGMARAICQVSCEAMGVDITDPMYSQYVEGSYRRYIDEDEGGTFQA